MQLRGVSRAGIATWLEVPELDVLFDLGALDYDALRRSSVLITHAHGDHIASLPRHAALRSMLGMKPVRYCVPESAVSDVHAWMEALARLEEIPGEAFTRPTLVGVKAGDVVALKPTLRARIVSAHHRVPSVGYILEQKRRVLREEFRGVPGAELAALRKDGVAIEDVRWDPMLTFLGDHTAQTLSEIAVWTAKVVVLEVTYLFPDERDKAAKWGHTHLDELVEALLPMADSPPFAHLVLKHFSVKYSAREIRARVDSVMPAALRARVHLLLP